MTWHVDTTSARRYAERRLDPVGAASVEAHLEQCATCRDVVGGALTGDDVAVLDGVWAALTERLDEPRLGWMESVLRRVGVGDVTARVIAATGGARRSYAIAVLASLVLAIVASRSPYDGVFALFLVISPLGPVVVTAAAFSMRRDPTGQLAASLPVPSLRTLLVRTVAAATPAVVLTASSVPWLLDRGWLAVGWLLPSVALVVAALALSSWMSIEAAASAVAGGWLTAVLGMWAWMAAPDLVDALTGPVQAGSLVAVAVGAAVMIVRRSAYDYRRA